MKFIALFINTSVIRVAKNLLWWILLLLIYWWGLLSLSIILVLLGSIDTPNLLRHSIRIFLINRFLNPSFLSLIVRIWSNLLDHLLFILLFLLFTFLHFYEVLLVVFEGAQSLKQKETFVLGGAFSVGWWLSIVNTDFRLWLILILLFEMKFFTRIVI